MLRTPAVQARHMAWRCKRHGGRIPQILPGLYLRLPLRQIKLVAGTQPETPGITPFRHYQSDPACCDPFFLSKGKVLWCRQWKTQGLLSRNVSGWVCRKNQLRVNRLRFAYTCKFKVTVKHIEEVVGIGERCSYHRPASSNL